MIRRWSRIISINTSLNNFLFLNKYSKINTFKNSVNFKRFKFKITKFKRKSIARIKHKSTWFMYTNIIKFWSKDYLTTKHLIKTQHLINIFNKNILAYNYNFIKNTNQITCQNFNFIVNSFTKKIFLILY